MNVACIAHAGSSDWPRLPEALAVLRRRFGRIPVFPVGSPGEAEATVADLARDVETLVVYGGDGTVHQVVNGLPLGAGNAPTVVILPGGTGNDLVRGLGLPADPVEAARVVVSGEPTPCDLLDTGAVRAANGVNAGFAAAATDVLSRQLKLALGRGAYVLGGAIAMVRWPHWPVTLEVGGGRWEGEAIAVVIGNGPSFGGGRWLLPGANPRDGLLDAAVVPREVAKVDLARSLVVHSRLPDGLPRFSGPTAELRTSMPCRLDGEALPTPQTVKVVPEGWRLLLPQRR
jgi:YegS/Rv2252/BmrU family lipid kinase